MSDWPKNPDDAPTANEIARALVKAAGATGETERLRALAQAGDAGAASNAILRARWLALAELGAAFPRAGVARIGRVLGASRPTQQLTIARQSGWWSDALRALAA